MKGTNQVSISSRPRAFALAPLLVILLMSAITATAHAGPLEKPTNVVARDYLTTGNRFYRLREFGKAIEEYKAGAVREDAPVFYYNLGQCYRQLGRYDDAIWHYERFLERGRPIGEVETSVNGFIAQMKGELEKKAMKQPPVEPAPPSPASPEQRLPAASPAEQRSGLPSQRKLAIGAGTAGVAVVALGVGLGLRAQSFKDDADEICPMSSCARADDSNELIDRGKTNALYANVALGVGVSVIFGAAVLWITGSPTERKTTTFAPQVSRTFVGVTASLKF